MKRKMVRKRWMVGMNTSIGWLGWQKEDINYDKNDSDYDIDDDDFIGCSVNGDKVT